MNPDLATLEEAVSKLQAGFASLPQFQPYFSDSGVREAILSAAHRLQENYPYHHPLYIGQMLKPPHPVARLAYALAMVLNPNNHALDGGRASSAMEKEAVSALAAMFGWNNFLGHLTGGGTMANFEALWIARELAPGKAIAASSMAHYTHSRLSAVLHTPFRSVPVDRFGRMNLNALEDIVNDCEVGTVVATLGTTALGAVDPLPEILQICRRRNVRVHVDAAYGGYFLLAENLDLLARVAFDALAEADSIVIDPHKHGLQPYGCGCVLFRDPAVGRFYKHDSPYTYFCSEELHLGEISLECSRPGATAVALWTTMQLLPLTRRGEFALSLTRCREAALTLHRVLSEDCRFSPILTPELDIVVWAVRATKASIASSLARRIFEQAAQHDLHLALTTIPRSLASPNVGNLDWDCESIQCLRACAMKPEHLDWIPEIGRRLSLATNEVLAQAD